MIILLHLIGLAAYLITGFGLVRLLLISDNDDSYRKNPGFMGGVFLLWPAVLFWVCFYWALIGMGMLFGLIGKAVLGSRTTS